MSNQSFNEIVKEYEAKTGKKVEVTYIPLSELDARLTSNPQDFVAYLHKLWSTNRRRKQILFSVRKICRARGSAIASRQTPRPSKSVKPSTSVTN